MIPTSRSRIVLYLVLIFVAGAISGAMVEWRTAKGSDAKPPFSPERMAEHMQKRFQERLSLTPDQMDKIRPILQRTAAEMKAIHRRSLEEMDQVNRRTNEEIARELTPDQRTKLEEMEKERQEFIQKRLHRSSSATNAPPQC